jgi:uncharacterized protein
MKPLFLKRVVAFGLLVLMTFVSFADDSKDFPQKPSTPTLVNDFAKMMSPAEQQQLEQVLENYSNATSTQISVVTVNSLNDHDIAEYTTALAEKWGIGKKEKNNGVLILASLTDRKMWIATGYGMEGVLPDATVFSIVNNEMKPAFKSGNYYQGFRNAANAIIQASKGEYTNEDKGAHGKSGGGVGLIVLVIIVIIILAAIKGGGRGGGGNYMSRSGGSFITGAILGSLLGGGGRGDSGGFGGSSGGGGGFGGFGGGGFGGGGAGGSW